MKKSLSDLGEFKLIDKISKIAGKDASVIKGIGDDCAVLKYKKNKYLLLASDMLVEGVHFKAKDALPEDIGHKALAVNISDIAACAGKPKWAVVSAGLPAEMPLRYAAGIYKGMERLARKFDMSIVGGDTNFSKKIVISTAIIGEVSKKYLTLRSGAKEGDIIVATGPLRKSPDHLRFIPKLRESRYISEKLMPSAMIDISDGFLSDLEHILNASNKSAVIYESLFPRVDKEGPLRGLLNIGEEFELLFTMPLKRRKALPEGFYAAGEIVAGSSGITYVDNSGNRERLTPSGYRHF